MYLPTVPAIEDDSIQLAVLRKLPPVVRSPGAATCAKPPGRYVQCAANRSEVPLTDEKRGLATSPFFDCFMCGCI